MWLILLLLLLTNPVQAEHINLSKINERNYVEAYRKFFEKEISADLFASQAQLNSSKARRQKILGYMQKNKLAVSDELIEKEWTNYLKIYDDLNDFQDKISDSYLDIKTIKSRFVNNLNFSKYFNEVVIPNIKKDIQLRKDIYTLAMNNNLIIDENKFKEELQQLMENFGGYKKFMGLMKESKLELTDLAFILRSEMLRQEILSGVLQDGIEIDSDLVENIDSAAKNLYYNASQSLSPRYYFKQAFISKEIKDAKSKITAAHEEFRKNHSIETLEAHKDIQVVSMHSPIEKFSALYHPKIKEAVTSLSNDDLFISKKISSVVETEKAYHVFQLINIENPGSNSLDDSKAKVIAKIKTRKSKQLINMLRRND